MEQYTARVQSVERIGENISLIYFTVKNKHFSYQAGQYVSVYFEGSSQVAGKAYSLASMPGDSVFSMAVKDIGEFSGLLCRLRPNDTFMCSAGYGHLDPRTAKPLVCFSGGIGVAPILSIIKNELAHDSQREIQLFCSYVTTGVIPFADEFHRLQKTYPNLHITYYITRQKTVPRGMQKGRLLLEQCLESAPKEPAYILCGSIAFVRDMWRGLAGRGVLAEHISAESFFE